MNKTVYLALGGDASAKSVLSLKIGDTTAPLKAAFAYNPSNNLTLFLFDFPPFTLPAPGTNGTAADFSLVDAPAALFNGSITLGTSADPTLANHYGYNSTAFATNYTSYAQYGSLSPATGRGGMEIGRIDIAQIDAGTAAIAATVKGNVMNETSYHQTLTFDGASFAYQSSLSSYDSGKDYTTLTYKKTSYSLPTLSAGQTKTLKF